MRAQSDVRKWAEALLVAAGVGAGVVSLFHAAAIVFPAISEPSPPWRHGLFIGVNLFFAWAFVKRVSWLPWPFGALCVQQAWSHGSAFMAARAVGHTDVQSLAVLLALPCVAILVHFGRDGRGRGSLRLRHPRVLRPDQARDDARTKSGRIDARP